MATFTVHAALVVGQCLYCMWSFTLHPTIHVKHEPGQAATAICSSHHGLSPILCDTVTIFVFIDQFSCHCVFIHSDFHWQLVICLHDVFLYCFCLFAVSFMIWNNNQSIFGMTWPGFKSSLTASKTCTLSHEATYLVMDPILGTKSKPWLAALTLTHWEPVYDILILWNHAWTTVFVPLHNSITC